MPSKEQPCIVGNERRQKDTPCIVGNERRQKDTPCIVGNQNPRQTSPGRAREGRTPLASRRPRECRGAERPTLAPTGTKILKRAVPASSETNAVKRTALHCRKRTSSKGQPLYCRKRTPSKGHPLHRRKRNLQKIRSRFVGNERRQKNSSCIVGNQTPRQSSPGRAREGRNPLAPRPRGGVGERSAPRSRRRERKFSREPFLLRRKRTPSKEQLLASSETEIPTRTAPGERERGRTLSHPVTRGGVGERSAPRPASSETNAFKRIAPASLGTKIPTRTAPGERERDAPLSHPVIRGGVGERSAPRPASSETNAFKRIAPRIVGNQKSRQNSPGELERV